MNKILIVAGFEFMQTARRWQFLLITLGLPLFVALIFWLSYISQTHAGKSLDLALKEGAKIYVSNVPEELLPVQGSEMVVADSCPPISKTVLACIRFDTEWLKTGTVDLIASEQKALGLATSLRKRIDTLIREGLLANRLSKEQMDRLNRSSQVSLHFQNEAGIFAYDYHKLLVPVLFTIIFILSLSTASTFLLQSVSEEKENRTMEILLSAMRDTELITGKVLGLGSAAMTQVFVWMLGFVLLVPPLAKNMGISIQFHQVPWSHWFLALLVLGMGFLMYAAIMIGVGALGANYKDSQQMSSFFLISSFLPLYVLQMVANDLNGPMAFFLGLFPLTSPMVIILRFCLGSIALWDLLLSLFCLGLGMAFSIFMAVRCFRIGSLSYQRRPTWKEIRHSLW